MGETKAATIYVAVTAQAIPGGTGGFDMSIRGCAQERDRVIEIAKEADRRIDAHQANARRLFGALEHAMTGWPLSADETERHHAILDELRPIYGEGA